MLMIQYREKKSVFYEAGPWGGRYVQISDIEEKQKYQTFNKQWPFLINKNLLFLNSHSIIADNTRTLLTHRTNLEHANNTNDS